MITYLTYRILERALEKINGTSQWVPISWVYWPIDSNRKGKYHNVGLIKYFHFFLNLEFILGNYIGVQRNNIEKHKNIASINTHGVTVC